MRVKRDEQLGPYRVLEIDGEKPPRYTHYRIGGKLFKPVPTHNLKPGIIAIEDTKTHKGEEIQFEMIS